jgi:Cellulase (glycosyl hydrolase family 5)
MNCVLALLSLLVALAMPGPAAAGERWSEQQARDWYRDQRWILGANYIPATAINQLEMWQADTFDPQRIDLELGWAEAIGMNSMRVFLHDLLWRQDAEGFRRRIDSFLGIAARHHIRILFVLFDSVWDPSPHLGPQHSPVPGVHNSGWVQSPSAAALSDPAQYPRLEEYVKGVVGAFAGDPRILGWDVWNEPAYSDKVGGGYAASEASAKGQRVRALLPEVFAWARAAGATQPLTSGVWGEDWERATPVSGTPRIQLEQSDVISFHSYDKPAVFERKVIALGRYHRPLICTEYMARGEGSTFEGTLPLARRYHVGAINWGLVQGKTQTIYPWDSWQKPYDHEPTPWFHDIFRTDGRPYEPQETALIRKMSATSRPLE